MRCPTCSQEPETDLKYCRKCGMPTVASPQPPVEESAAAPEPADETPTLNLTSRIGTVDVSSQSQAQPVVRRAEPEADGAEPDAPAEAKEPEPPGEPSRPGSGARHRTRARARRADDLAHDRSVQKLSRAVIVIHVSTMAAVIVLVLVFVSSLKGWVETTVALSRESAAANCQAETLRARLGEKDGEVAELKQASVMKDGQIDGKDAELEKKNAEIRRISSERDEARLAVLSQTLNSRERLSAGRVLTAVLAKAKTRNARPELAAQIAALRRKVIRGENRPEIVKDYNRLFPKLDQQTRAQLEETVGRTLMGE